jgi:hypothetical protein
MLKNIAVTGVHWPAYATHQPDLVRETFGALSALHAQGAIRPLTSRIYPLEEVATALADLGSRKTHGKVILQPRSACGAHTTCGSPAAPGGAGPSSSPPRRASAGSLRMQMAQWWPQPAPRSPGVPSMNDHAATQTSDDRRVRRLHLLGVAGTFAIAALAAGESLAAAVGTGQEGVRLAYVDPGTGSFVIQAVVAMFAGAAVALKVYWTKLMGLFGGDRKSDDLDGDDPLDG